MRSAVVLSFTALLLFACDNSSRPLPVCTTESEPAVIVDLRDVDTTTPVEGATIQLTDEDGGYSEPMREIGEGEYRGGFERPGTYSLTVTVAGYRSVTRSGVVAPARQCGPETQLVTIELEPETIPILVIREEKPGVWGGEIGVLSAR